MDHQRKARGKAEKMHYRDCAKQQFPAKKWLTYLHSPAASWGWVWRLRLQGLVIRERTGANCYEDNMKKKKKKENPLGHQRNKRTFHGKALAQYSKSAYAHRTKDHTLVTTKMGQAGYGLWPQRQSGKQAHDCQQQKARCQYSQLKRL